jgi:hypothetical protein
MTELGWCPLHARERPARWKIKRVPFDEFQLSLLQIIILWHIYDKLRKWPGLSGSEQRSVTDFYKKGNEKPGFIHRRNFWPNKKLSASQEECCHVELVVSLLKYTEVHLKRWSKNKVKEEIGRPYWHKDINTLPQLASNTQKMIFKTWTMHLGNVLWYNLRLQCKYTLLMPAYYRNV